MNASSIENEQQREVGKPHAAATVLPCPPWCTLPSDHDPEERFRFHEGPRFGTIRTSYLDVDQSIYVEIPEHDFGKAHGDANPVALASALRALSADIERAAAWVEAHQ